MSCSNQIPNLDIQKCELPQQHQGSTYAITIGVNDKLLVSVDVPHVGKVSSLISVGGVWSETDERCTTRMKTSFKVQFNIHKVEI